MIEKTIASLKKRLEQNNHVLTLQLENGYITEATCRFFKPITENDITKFTDRIGYELPHDYTTFLKITNGCDLFYHPYYGGEDCLYGLWEIFNVTYEEPSDGYLKVGCLCQVASIVLCK